MNSKKIIFICSGNVHRSILAEIVCEDVLLHNNLTEKYLISSRGLQGAFNIPRSRHDNLPQYTMEWEIDKPIMDELGVDTSLFFTKTSTPVQPEDIEQADLVIAMDSKAANILHEQLPAFSDKILPFSALNEYAVDVEDCADQYDQSLHKAVNTEIVTTIRDHACDFFDEYFNKKSAPSDDDAQN